MTHAYRSCLRLLAAALLLISQTACLTESSRPSARAVAPTPTVSSPTAVTRSGAAARPTPAEGRLRTILARDAAALRRAEYTPDTHLVNKLPDGTLLLIFHSVCTGSADGHCQAVDVFRNGERRALWHHQYAGVLGLRLQRDGFSVKAVQYASGDPLCCASLPPVVHVYRWNGHRFSESTGPPRSTAG